MKTLCHLPLLCLLLTPSCTEPGNWEKDSLFFSPRRGIERLGAMRAEMDRIEMETAARRRETARLESRFQQAVLSKNSARAESERLAREINNLDSKLNGMRNEMNGLNTENTVMADRARVLQTEIMVLEARVSRLRRQLELAIKTR